MNIKIGNIQLLMKKYWLSVEKIVKYLKWITNALNVEIEEKVIKAVRNVMRQKTLIIVTHKVEILKYCEKIISIEKNKIKTFNSFKEIKNLIKKN